MPRFRKATVLPLTGETQSVSHAPPYGAAAPSAWVASSGRAGPLRSSDLSEYLSVCRPLEPQGVQRPRNPDYPGRVPRTSHDFSRLETQLEMQEAEQRENRSLSLPEWEGEAGTHRIPASKSGIREVCVWERQRMHTGNTCPGRATPTRVSRCDVGRCLCAVCARVYLCVCVCARERAACWLQGSPGLQDGAGYLRRCAPAARRAGSLPASAASASFSGSAALTLQMVPVPLPLALFRTCACARVWLPPPAPAPNANTPPGHREPGRTRGKRRAISEPAGLDSSSCSVQGGRNVQQKGRKLWIDSKHPFLPPNPGA